MVPNTDPDNVFGRLGFVFFSNTPCCFQAKCLDVFIILALSSTYFHGYGRVRVLHKNIIDHAITFCQNPSFNFGLSFPTLSYFGIMASKPPNSVRLPIEKTNQAVYNSFNPMGITVTSTGCFLCVSRWFVCPQNHGVLQCPRFLYPHHKTQEDGPL